MNEPSIGLGTSAISENVKTLPLEFFLIKCN